MRCAKCGYFREAHVERDRVLRCPVCSCGEHAENHWPVAEPPSPMLSFMRKGKITYPCPGADTQLRHGRFAEPPPIDPALYPEIITRDVVARGRAIEDARLVYVPEVVLPPQVAARPPASPGEIAGYGGKQAIGLGRKAAGLGWRVAAYYWRTHDGTEGCAVKLNKGPLNAVATWTRAAGKQGGKQGWGAAEAYAWRADANRFPDAVTHTQLEGLIE